MTLAEIMTLVIFAATILHVVRDVENIVGVVLGLMSGLMAINLTTGIIKVPVDYVPALYVVAAFAAVGGAFWHKIRT